MRGMNGDYAGDIVIPERVSYENKEYTVTTIGYQAFIGCGSLNSVIIPSSSAPSWRVASDNAVKIYGITVIPDSTGIFLPTVTPTFTGADTYYDLNGRKVKQPVKGLYIKNGKKYVVKDF